MSVQPLPVLTVTNNKTKVLKRVCFGMRNFRNFRNRILFAHT